MLNPTLIFIPVLVQVLTVLVVYIRLGQAKETARQRNEVDLARRALHDDAWPEYVQKINNNIRNQFETPVLFYVLVFTLWALQAAGLVAQLLAWLYVLLRVAHTVVHTGSNVVRIRKRLFQLSILSLMALTGLVALALLMQVAY